MRLGLLTRQMYVDSSLVRAKVSGKELSPSGMRVEENDLFVLREEHFEVYGEEKESVSYYQDPKGRLPLSPVDTDAGWRTARNDKRAHLHYQENIIVE